MADPVQPKTYPVDPDKLDKSFSYYPPKEDQIPRYVAIRDAARGLADTVLSLTPGSREQSLAMTKLEEVVMWANAAIARNE